VQSVAVTVVICTFINTSLSLTIGLAKSVILSTSGKPYFLYAIAFNILSCLNENINFTNSEF
jgi:hypothetical protein